MADTVVSLLGFGFPVEEFLHSAWRAIVQEKQEIVYVVPFASSVI